MVFLFDGWVIVQNLPAFLKHLLPFKFFLPQHRGLGVFLIV
jgi:hypothetical protein